MHYNCRLSRLKHLFFGLFLLCLAYAVPASLHAQGTGVSINPATIEETLDPGAVNSYSLKVENLNSNEQTFYLFTRNISGVREGGSPIFAQSNLEVTGYELADWITLPYDQITIPGEGIVHIEFTMEVPENASPGSHFGGVFLSVEPPEIEKSGAAVGYQVANIISIRVSGEAVEQASIRQFSTSKFLYGSQNVDFLVRIENTGNVLVRPTGPLEVFNMLGNKVGSITFNPDQSAVFPNDSRDFLNVNWTGDSLGFGRYEAIVSPVYGDLGAKKTMSTTVSFWILPMSVIGPAALALGVLLLITFIIVKLYIRRSLAHLSQGRRLVRRRRNGNSSALLLVVIVSLTVTALFLIVLLALFA
tara:strand:+ start:13701 stop:14780 length:1080 start_codon:yes stop_codon:yes gene_type:complete